MEKKTGRPGKYEYWISAEGLLLVTGWARNGLTEAQMAYNMDINVKTLYEWKNRFPDFSKALKESKEKADLAVENALYKRALGYKTEETKVEILPDGTRRAFQVTKEVPPDVTAAIFWLKNRRREQWRDKPDKENADTEDAVAYFEEAGI